MSLFVRDGPPPENAFYFFSQALLVGKDLVRESVDCFYSKEMADFQNNDHPLSERLAGTHECSLVSERE